MLALGVVDRVVDQGCGETEVANFIKLRGRNRNAMAGIAATRRCVHKLDYEELTGVVEVWADTALSLSNRDLKLMQRLVSRQNALRPVASSDDSDRQDDSIMARHLH